MLKEMVHLTQTSLQMMILGHLSRVMMVRQPFSAKNMKTLHFLCAKFSPARMVLYLQLSRALLGSNKTTQQFNTTTGVQKVWHRTVLSNQRAVPEFLNTCGAIVSEYLQCYS